MRINRTRNYVKKSVRTIKNENEEMNRREK